jgi:hypothetical protein
VPAEALHVTVVFTAPETVAVNGALCPASTVAVVGLTLTETAETFTGALQLEEPPPFVAVIV